MRPWTVSASRVIGAGAAAACLAAALATEAQAIPVLDLLVPGGINRLEDDAGLIVLDHDLDARLSLGDELHMVMGFQQLSAFDSGLSQHLGFGGANEVTAALAATVVSVSSFGGGGFQYELAAASDPLQLGWASGTILELYDDPTPDVDLQASTFGDALASATDGTRLWSFGFAGLGEVFHLLLQSDQIADLTGFQGGSSARFVLNVTEQGAAQVRLGIMADPFGQGQGQGAGGQIIGNMSLGGFNRSSAFDGQADVDLLLLPEAAAAVPEPGALVLAVAAGAALATQSLRRRRQIRASAGALAS